MSKPPAADEWQQLIVKMGELTVAAGYLEMAIIAMVCRILNKTEGELNRLKIRHNWQWCKKLRESCPTTWSDAERQDLGQRIDRIRDLYLKRNELIHAALGTVSDDSIPGVPAGSIIDIRSHGLGIMERTATSVTVGVVGRRVDLDEIAALTEAIHTARVELGPYMELVDQIKHQSPADFARWASLDVGQKISG